MGWTARGQLTPPVPDGSITLAKLATGVGDARWAQGGGLTLVTSSTPPAAGTPATTITFVP